MADSFSSMVDSTAAATPLSTIMTLPAETEKKQNAALADLKVKQQASLTKQDEIWKSAYVKYNEAMSSIKKATPNLQDVPDAPNQKFQDPTQVLGSLGTILAIFGSMKTRAPMTSALNSMAAAMKGFHQGDQEAVKLNTEKWQNDFKKALAQNQIEMQRYMAIMEDNKFNIANAQGALKVAAIEMGDEQFRLSIDDGNFTKQTGYMSARLNSATKIAELIQKEHDLTQQRGMAAQQHADAAAALQEDRNRRQSNYELTRSDINTRAFIADARRQVKPYQDTIRKINDIESNLTPGMELSDTVKVELKQLAGTRQASKWTQGLDKYTGDIVTRIFSRAERGALGKLSQQDADAMKAFTANVKAINAGEIQKVKSSMKPYADQYKIPALIFDMPFSDSEAVGDLGEAYPGMDQSAADALGITKDMVGGQ